VQFIGAEPGDNIPGQAMTVILPLQVIYLGDQH
jgi:hypothetical protein